MSVTAFVRTCVAIVAVAAAWHAPAVAQDGRAPEADAAAARGVLAARCAGCHMGEPGQEAPARGPADILDLARVARDPALVRPGFADGSAVYAALAGSHLGEKLEPVPSSEVAAVARWIDGLGGAAPDCSGRQRVAGMDAEALVALAVQGREQTAGIRFVSLVPLWNGCLPAAEVQAYRDAVPVLLQRLAGRTTPVPATTLGGQGLVLAFRLADMGWTAAQWDELADDVPAAALGGVAVTPALQDTMGAKFPVLPADLVAARLAARGPDAVAGGVRVRGRAVLAALAAERVRAVGLVRVAADMGLAPDVLAARLKRVIGALKPAARRLRQDVVSRAAADAVMEAVAAEPAGPPGAPTPAVGSGPAMPVEDGLQLTVWSERATYRTGEQIVFFAWANRPCHLTLVSVETNGRATVLFPNDTDMQNEIEAAHEVQVPPIAAGYRLRAGKPGRERLIGLCHTTAEMPPGMLADYEHERFTSLGDWRAFEAANVGVAAEGTAGGKAEGEAGATGARRKPKADAAASDDESARAAIFYDVVPQ